MRLLPCPRCNHHVRADEKACPHCQAPLLVAGRLTQTAAALLLGLLPIACASTEQPPAEANETKAQPTSKPQPKPEPKPDAQPEPKPDSVPDAAAYGAPPTDSDGPDAKPEPPVPVAEPEYGVPITETPPEPHR